MTCKIEYTFPNTHHRLVTAITATTLDDAELLLLQRFPSAIIISSSGVNYE